MLDNYVIPVGYMAYQYYQTKDISKNGEIVIGLFVANLIINLVFSNENFVDMTLFPSKMTPG